MLPFIRDEAQPPLPSSPLQNGFSSSKSLDQAHSVVSSWRAPTSKPKKRVAGIDFSPTPGRQGFAQHHVDWTFDFLSIPNLYKNLNRHKHLVSNKRKFDIFGRRDEDNRYLFLLFLIYKNLFGVPTSKDGAVFVTTSAFQRLRIN